jgi:magnesium-transporting ATPase (P-type)
VHPFALLLWIAGGVAFIVREPVLGVVIWVLVLVNAAFSFWREHRAEQAMLALRRLLPAYTRAVRDGKEVSVPASEIVPGDLLVLSEGDYIPADARVIEEYGLRVSQATLTGEAVPARKTEDASFREGVSELERPNLVFASTTVISGTGRAVVYATGMLTQFGRVAHLTQSVQEEASPFQDELVQVTQRIALIALGIGGLVFLVAAMDIGLDLREAFLLSLGILVAAIPEGLPATVTLSLAMAAQRLAQKAVLVKKLSVIETLGTLSIICTDKSGTLTKNQMTVREIWTGGERLKVTGVGYEPIGGILAGSGKANGSGELRMLLFAASLCNNSRLSEPTQERPTWSYLGDQTEAAMRVAAIKGGVDQANLQSTYPRIHELPFDARRKRMSTIHLVKAEGGRRKDESATDSSFILHHPSGTPPPTGSSPSSLVFVKGAPREVLDLCSHILMENQVVELDQSLRRQISTANDEYAARALRVLALAYRELPDPPGNFTVERELPVGGGVPEG